MSTESVIVLAGFAVAIVIARVLLEQELKAISAPAVKTIADDAVRPVELSFLAGGGDMTNVLTVLAVDLLQRAVKSKLSGAATPPLIDYEEKLWLVTKRYVSDSAADIIGSVSPDKILSDPLGYWKKISSIYKLIVKLLKTFTSEVISDPRRLRKYFSLGWITRLVIDFSSSDFRERLKIELIRHLTDKGLIVEQNKRLARSKLFMLAAGGLAFSAAAFVFLEVGAKAGVVMLVGAMFTAGLLKLSLYLAGFLPLYSEISSVLDHVKRKDWRINCFRIVMRIVKIGGLVGLVFIFLSGTITSWLAADFVLQQVASCLLYLQIALTITLFLLTDMFWRGIELANSEVATTYGEARVKEARTKLSKVGPVGAFREMLQDEQYEPDFSEIVALYGIEPLLFLA